MQGRPVYNQRELGDILIKSPYTRVFDDEIADVLSDGIRKGKYKKIEEMADPVEAAKALNERAKAESAKSGAAPDEADNVFEDVLKNEHTKAAQYLIDLGGEVSEMIDKNGNLNNAKISKVAREMKVAFPNY